MRNRFFAFLVTSVILIAPRVVLAGNDGHQRLAKLTWSVYTYTGKGTSYSPPSCHKLGYFLGSPLRFDYGQDLFQFKPDLFTYTSKTNLIGTVQGERVYQIVQKILPPPRKASGKVIVMKRLIVERHVNHFCMIFQEQGPIAPSEENPRVKPATIEASGRGPVLRTDDPLKGNQSPHVNAAWLFLRGVPVPLSLPNNLVEQMVRPIVPASCGVPLGDTSGNLRLIYHSQVWRKTDNSGNPKCGSVVLRLSVSNHKLVLLTKKYIP